MNTPRSKPLVRFNRPARKSRRIPDGQYRQGLYDEAMILTIGRIITMFPILEHGMIAFLEDLLGGSAPARQVFYSIVNQQARIKVMRSLLEQSSQNNEKDSWYDWVLDEFKAVGDGRNNYAHGLWWTGEDGRTYLSLDEVSSIAAFQWREVKPSEIEATYDRMLKLRRELMLFEIKRLDEVARQNASRDTPPQPPSEESSTAPPAPRTTAEERQPQPQPSDPSPQSDGKA